MISLGEERNNCSSKDATPIRSTAGCHAKGHLASGYTAESERTDTVATHLLEDGDDSRAAQELLGVQGWQHHNGLHQGLNRGGRGVVSPVDRL